MTYEALKAALEATGIPLAEYAWDSPPDADYAVLSLDGGPSVIWADDHMTEQALEGTVDLFTRSADREKMEQIQSVINALPGVAWRFSSLQYENDTRLLHWEWVFQVDGAS